MPVTTLDPKTALVVIDLQKGIVALPTIHPIDEVVQRAGELADAFRRCGLPVVLVNVDGGAPGRTDHPRPRVDSLPGWTDLVPGLNRQGQDPSGHETNLGRVHQHRPRSLSQSGGRHTGRPGRCRHPRRRRVDRPPRVRTGVQRDLRPRRHDRHGCRKRITTASRGSSPGWVKPARPAKSSACSKQPLPTSRIPDHELAARHLLLFRRRVSRQRHPAFRERR